MGRSQVRGAGQRDRGRVGGRGAEHPLSRGAEVAAAAAPRFGRELLADFERASRLEWLVTNGIGGYAAGTAVGAVSRRYHGLLVAAIRPPVDRVVTVSHLEEVVHAPWGGVSLSCHAWPDGVVDPRGHLELDFFTVGRRPSWRWRVRDLFLEKTLFMPRGRNTVVLEYRHLGGPPVELSVRPFVVMRDHHGATREDVKFHPLAESSDGRVRLMPYPEMPVLWLVPGGGRFLQWPVWYKNFEWAIELERGLDGHEDAMSPGTFAIPMAEGERWLLAFSTEAASDAPPAGDALGPWADAAWRAEEARLAEVELGPDRGRAALARARAETAAGHGDGNGDDGPDGGGLATATEPRLAAAADRLPVGALALLARAADQFVVEGAHGATVIAGYPWFTDWGRDTMISLPGLLLATGRPEAGRAILATFVRFLDHGVLPNRFPEGAAAPEYNTVDASLWFAVAADAYLALTGDEAFLAATLAPALDAILEGYAAGTHYGIRERADGLIEAGETGVALTWMDARVEGRVITPRRGAPVEIGALWYNAWRTRRAWAERLGQLDVAARAGAHAERVRKAFRGAYWNPSLGWLADVVDDYGPDPALRPNQLYALSLPHPVFEGPEARLALEAVERHLLTPFGPRTLDAGHAQYRGVYVGDRTARDEAYHNGTVWPFLVGAWADAHFRVRGRTAATRAHARRVLEPLVQHLLADACVGSISEVFDGDLPQQARGCFAQAWSVAELARIWIAEDL